LRKEKPNRALEERNITIAHGEEVGPAKRTFTKAHRKISLSKAPTKKNRWIDSNAPMRVLGGKKSVRDPKKILEKRC